MHGQRIWCRQMQSSAVNTLVCLRRRDPSLALLARDANPGRIGALVCLRDAIALGMVYRYALAADREFDGSESEGEARPDEESRRIWGAPCRGLSEPVALAPGGTLLASNCRLPGAAFGGGDLVAAERRLQ